MTVCRDCQEQIVPYEDGQWHVEDFYTFGTPLHELVNSRERVGDKWYNGFSCPMDEPRTRKRHIPEPELVPYLRQVLSGGTE